MRALPTDGVRVHQVKAYHTELATTCPLHGLQTEIHWTSTWEIANEIHDPIIDGLA